jgi:hypothetical protein
MGYERRRLSSASRRKMQEKWTGLRHFPHFKRTCPRYSGRRDTRGRYILSDSPLLLLLAHCSRHSPLSPLPPLSLRLPTSISISSKGSASAVVLPEPPLLPMLGLKVLYVSRGVYFARGERERERPSCKLRPIDFAPRGICWGFFRRPRPWPGETNGQQTISGLYEWHS